EFCEHAFKELDIELEWRGKNESEKGINKKTGKVIIEVDPRYYRPTEVDLLIGDASKAKEKLGWEPKVKFEELVKIMVQADWEKVQKKGY
ncbi:MAG: GDP-mannose 4,6-dehydratase, partial [Promethearchaeota archaeon]